MGLSPLIWVVGDGKAGHENQSMGLAMALGRVIGARVERRGVERRGAWSRVIAPAPPVGEGGAPAMAIGAGASTHATVLACRRVYGAKAVALMNPGWRRRGFDLCVIPEHDGVREGERVVVTKGAINLVRPSHAKDERAGLVLVGGPSKHHAWDAGETARQIRSVVERGGVDRAWTLTTSRRTPQETLEALERAFADAPALRARLEVWPVERTGREWLLERYAESAEIWVSEDSVSMVYEAITSGARVGLLRVERVGDAGRVVRGLDALLRDGWATSFEEWSRGGALRRAPGVLDEADRVARLVAERFGFAGGDA